MTSPQGQVNIALAEILFQEGDVMKKMSVRLTSVLLALAMLASTVSLGIIPVAAAEERQTTNVDSSTIIENADSLANGVQAYFKDADRDNFIVENQQMKFEYNLREEKNMLLAYLKDKAGNSYIENTLDAFVVMSGESERIYASDSKTTALPNLHRFGYYYYDARMEGQSFISGYNIIGTPLVKKFAVQEAKDMTFSHPSSFITTTYGQVSAEITSTSDPGLYFKKESSGWLSKNDAISFNADKYQYIRITMSSDSEITSGSFFFGIPGDKNDKGAEFDFNESMRVDFSIAGDGVNGNQKVYMVPMFTNANYKGTIDALRLDFNATAKGAKLNITKLELVEVEMGANPYGLYVNRDFLVYSDKMHSFTQFTATQELNNVAEVGVEVKIPKTNVEGYVVKADGTLYNNSIAVSDWDSAEYVGFIIKDAGVFGYIMPADDSYGKLTVTDDGTNYVVTQTIPLDNNTIIPSTKGMKDENGNADPNGNDVFVAQRLYTDDNSDLATFIKEAENERNPIPAENFIVSEDSDGTYAGYDAVRGCYRFNINGFGGFATPYFSAQNKQFKINYTIIGEENQDRNIWVMTYGSSGSLECAAILDENEMMIPVPLQVGKNFSEAHGERNKYNLDDPTYSEVIYPMEIKAGSENEYTILNLYQNWGQYPLKQLSWIQYSAPYYHLSTGVNESNCITPLYSMGKVTGHSTLPDFRGMSAPLWPSDPQHNSCGNHKWLIYTDASGKEVATESTSNIISSYGPNYASVDMHYITDDGKIKVTYTHMEMPQTDENRTYYEMQYEVLEDVTFTDFKNQLQFYSVKPNDPTGYYTRLGYLNSNNESAVVDAKREGSGTAQYVLGNECPYFSYFDMDNPTSTSNKPEKEGYSNVAFLVYNSDFTIGGNKATPDFIITDRGGEIAISLDLGAVTLKAGDKITINAILLPWGSQEMEGSYDTIQDQNVRDVRANTLLDPITVTPTADPAVTNATVTTEKVASAFLPRVKTTNGSEAVFTLSGGENNQTVRVDGFTKLTDPKIYELQNSAWVEYNVCSALTPDGNGDGYSYDGYGVYFDSDTGTYGYTFVVDMTGDESRTFKVVADEDFDGWEISLTDTQISQGMNFISSGEKLYESSMLEKGKFGNIEFNPTEEDIDYVRYTSKPNNDATAESYFYPFSNESSTIITGNYVVIKYRTVNKTLSNRLEIYTATTSKNAGGSSYNFGYPIKDDEWHVAVLDLVAMNLNHNRVVPDENGTLRAKHLRIDIFNYMKTVEQFDVAYIGMCDSISEVFSYDPSLTEIQHVKANTTEGISIVKKSELEGATISVGNVTADPSGTFSVPVIIDGNEGFSYLDIMPVFDKDQFNFAGYTEGDVSSDVTISGNRFILKNTEDITENGTLINLIFSPKTEMAMGSTAEFSVKVIDANNISGYGVNTLIESGKVTFTIQGFGDVNGDKVVNLNDVVTLRYYLVAEDGAIDVNSGADANCDGTIDTKDLLLLRKYLAYYDYKTGESSIVLGPQ